MKDFDQIVGSIKACNSPEKYDLTERDLDDEDIGRIGDALPRNITLHQLNLSRNKFTHAGIEKFAKGLAVNLHLFRIDISHNFIGPIGITLLAECFERNESVSELKLNYCALTGSTENEEEIDVSGLCRFAQAIEKNCGLETLELRGNCLTDFGENEKGFDLLMKCCSRCTSLVTLDISENGLGATGADIIRNRLMHNSTLHCLKANKNCFQVQGAIAIGKMLETNRGITKLSLRDNDMTLSGTDTTGLELLSTSLSAQLAKSPSQEQAGSNQVPVYHLENRNTTLWHIDLRANSISYTMEDIFSEMLRFNTSIIDLRCRGDFRPYCTAAVDTKLRMNETTRHILKDPKHANKDLASKADREGQTILHRAVALRCVGIVYELTPLLPHTFLNAQTKLDRLTPLHYAALNPDEYIATMLIRHGVSLDILDRNGNSPLHLVLSNNDIAFGMLLLEAGACSFIKNRYGKIPYDCVTLQHSRQVIEKVSGRLDALVICSADVFEQYFTKSFVYRLRRDYALKVHFIHSTADLIAEGYPHYYASTILVVVGSVGAKRKALCLQQKIKECRKNAEWNISDIVDLERDMDLTSRCLYVIANNGGNDLAKDLDIGDGKIVDLSEWGEQVMKHHEVVKLQKKNIAVNRGKNPKKEYSYLKALAKKKFRPSILDRLEQAWPEPSEFSQHSLQLIVETIRSNSSTLRSARMSRLPKFVGPLADIFALEKLLESASGFAFIVDTTGGLHYAHGKSIQQHIDRLGVASWVWPHPCAIPYQAGLKCPCTSFYDLTVQKGLSRAKCVVSILDRRGTNCKQTKPMKDALKSVFETIKLHDIPVLDYVMYDDSLAAPANANASFASCHGDHRNRDTLNLLVHSLGKHVKNVALGKEEQVATPEHLVDQEDRIRSLEQELLRKEKQLAASLSLNRELFHCVDTYHQRWRDAVRVLNPATVPKSTHERELRRLYEERLRIQGSHAGEVDTIPTTLFQDLGESPEEIVIQVNELRTLVDKRILDKELDCAAIEIQKIWRSCYARELLRRRERNVSAIKIQRCYRLFRFKILTRG